MTHTIDDKTTKKELKEILKQWSDKRIPVGLSTYFIKLKLP